MARFHKKVSNHISRQVPEFVLSEHPQFVDFLKQYFIFMESAMIVLKDISSTDGLTIETETANSFNIILDGTKITNDRTVIDSGDKILLESSVFGKFENGETITGASSGASSTILADDVDNNKLYVIHESHFQKGEIITGASSGAQAVIDLYKPNPVQTIQELLNYRDPDKVIDTYLTQFRDDFLNTLPDSLATGLNKRNFIKNVKSLYQTKGTNVGHSLFFRVLFNELSETIYPRDNMLRVSDGKWSTQLIMRCTDAIGDTLKLVGRTLTQNNVADDNDINKATAVIENVFKFQIGATEITEFVLSRGSIEGTFVVGQSVIATENDDDTLVIKATISGIPDVFTITNDGALYSAGDTVTLSDTGGDGAIVQVNEVGHGQIDDIVIDDGGTGYEVGDALVFDNSSTGGNSVQAKVSLVNGGFTPEDANSNSDGSFTDDHIILEDETQKGDIYTGNKFVQESGTGSGDITDIRFINNGYGYNSLPSITVTSSGGADASLIASGSEVGRLLSVKVPNHGVGYDQSPSPPTVSFTQNLILKDTTVANFTAGETVTGNDSSSTVITALVVSYNDSLKLLKVKSSTGTFEIMSTITGATSGASGSIAKNDRATATVTVNTTTTTSGAFVNQDGHVSEDTMRIQDSLYYQDFSYVIKVGRSIEEWRDSFKKTMHTAGFYLAGEVNTETRLNAQIKTPVEGITTGISETPIMSVFDFIFSPLIGRRLGTASDGTTLKATPQAVGSSADRSTFLTDSTRDVTLTKETKVSFLVKEKTTIRGNVSAYGRPVSNNFKTLNNFLLAEYLSTRITVEDLENLTLTGTLDTNIDGLLAQVGDFETGAKTNFTLMSEIWSNSEDSFDETLSTFDATDFKFDVE